MFHRTTRRLGLIATCIAFVACASAPEPTKRKLSRKERLELKEKREKRKKKREAEKRRREREKEREREQAERDPEEPAEDEDVVTITDDTSIDEEPKKPRKPKKVAAKPARKQAPKQEPEGVEEDEDEDEDDEEEDRPTKVAARAKARPKAKTKAKARETAVDMSDVEDDDGDEPPPRAKARPKQPTKTKKKDPVDEELIEMDGVDDEEPERRVAAIPVPGVDDDSPIDDLEDDEAPGAPPNPLSINDRSLTLAKDRLAVHGGLRVGVLTLPGPTPADPGLSSTATGFALGGTYGVSDKAEIGADYTLGLSPGTVKGPFTLRGVYRASEGKKLEVALAAGLAVDFFEQTNTITMTTTTTTFAGLHLGAWARYRVNPKTSLFTGVPGLPSSAASMTKLAFPLPPLPYQLAIGLNNGGAIALDLPVGVGYQASPKVYAFGMLNLAHIRIANTANAFVFADFIPVVLGGFYSLDKLDIGAVFSDDLKQGTDYLRFDVTVRYFLK